MIRTSDSGSSPLCLCIERLRGFAPLASNTFTDTLKLRTSPACIVPVSTIRRSLRAREAYSERAECGIVYYDALRRRIA